MADKKDNCGCGCMGQKPGSAKATSDNQKPKRSK